MEQIFSSDNLNLKRVQRSQRAGGTAWYRGQEQCSCLREAEVRITKSWSQSLPFLSIIKWCKEALFVQCRWKALGPLHQACLVLAAPPLLSHLPAKTSTRFVWVTQNSCMKTARFPPQSRVTGTCHLDGHLDWQVSKAVEGVIGGEISAYLTSPDFSVT